MASYCFLLHNKGSATDKLLSNKLYEGDYNMEIISKQDINKYNREDYV